MKKRTVALLLVLVLLVGCIAGGTVAWLMDTTETITNTFTVGNIDIELTEVQDTDSDKAESFKMVPGNTINKQPQVTVKANSEACWLFIRVNESANLKTFITYSVDTTQAWTAMSGHDGFYYRSVDSLTTQDTTFDILDGNQVKVNDTVTKTDMDGLKGTNAVQPTLSFTAAAVQKDNVDTVDAAWEKLPDAFKAAS